MTELCAPTVEGTPDENTADGAGPTRTAAAGLRRPLPRAVAALIGLLVLIVSWSVLVVPAKAASNAPLVTVAAPDAPVTLVLFHGEGCPHCASERLTNSSLLISTVSSAPC